MIEICNQCNKRRVLFPTRDRPGGALENMLAMLCLDCIEKPPPERDLLVEAAEALVPPSEEP